MTAIKWHAPRSVLFVRFAILWTTLAILAVMWGEYVTAVIYGVLVMGYIVLAYLTSGRHRKNKARKFTDDALMDRAHQTVMWRDAVKPSLEHFKDQDKEWWAKWGDPEKVAAAAFLDDLIAPEKPKVAVQLRIGPPPVPVVEHTYKVHHQTLGGEDHWSAVCACGKRMESVQSERQVRYYMNQHVLDAERQEKMQKADPYAAYDPSDGEWYMSPEQLQKHEIRESVTFGTIVNPYEVTRTWCTCGALIESNGTRDPEDVMRIHRQDVEHRDGLKDRAARGDYKAVEELRNGPEYIAEFEHRMGLRAGSFEEMVTEEEAAAAETMKRIKPQLSSEMQQWLEDGAP